MLLLIINQNMNKVVFKLLKLSYTKDNINNL